MYFWNIDALNKDLKKGISQKEDFAYMLAYTILGSILYFIPNEVTFFDVLDGFVSVAFGLILLCVFFRVNGGNKGKNFLSRYFAISFVGFIRSIVYFLIPLVLVYAITLAIITGGDIPSSTSIYDVIFSATYLTCYFFLTISYLKELVRK